MKSKKIIIISALFLLVTNFSFSQTYTSLNIPEAYYGVTGTDGVTNFVLNMDENLKQFRTGQATVTGAVNIGTATTNTFWGPTMIINKDQAIKMHVTNNLNES